MNTYLERPYHHRHQAGWFASTAMIAMAGLAAWGLQDIISREKDPFGSVGLWLAMVVLSAFIALFLYAGILTGHAWFTNKVDYLRVKDDGIEHFGKLVPWKNIQWLSCSSPRKDGELMLFYQKAGFGFDRHLPVDVALSKEEVEALFQELEDSVKPKFGHLKIG